MAASSSVRSAFASRVRAREVLAGTFVKSSDPVVIELLAQTGLDFAIVDAEHSAFGRAQIGVMMMAGRAAGLPLLVRIPDHEGHWIATALDAGAAGIVAPQVPDAARAAQLAARMHYGQGGRGFSPSTAGAEYGTRGIVGHLARQIGETVLICQIEEPSAVAMAESIAAVPGVDGLLVGPVDLAVSAGFGDPDASQVVEMTRDTVASAGRQGKSGGLFLGRPDMARKWQNDGASLFVLGTDQGFVIQGARRALADMKGPD